MDSALVDAVKYFESLSVESSSEAHNDAEWLTDVVVKADRSNRAEEFGNQFANSPQRQALPV